MIELAAMIVGAVGFFIGDERIPVLAVCVGFVALLVEKYGAGLC